MSSSGKSDELLHRVFPSSDRRSKLLLLQQQHQQNHVAVCSVVGDRAGGGDVSSNNLCTGNSSSTSIGALGTATCTTAGTTAPTSSSNKVSRVKTKLVIRKGNSSNQRGGGGDGAIFGSAGNTGTNVLYHQYQPHRYYYQSPVTTRRAQRHRKIYSNPVVGVISSGDENDYSSGVDEHVNLLESGHLLTSYDYNYGRGERYARSGSSGRGLSPSPSTAAGSGCASINSGVGDRVVKLTTKVTTLEEILRSQEESLLGRGTMADTEESKEGSVGIDGGSGDIDGRCHGTVVSTTQPKKTVQFKRFSGRNVASAPAGSSSTVAGGGPCSSSSVTVASSSKSHKGSSLIYNPKDNPQITISPLPPDDQHHEHSHASGSGGALSNISADENSSSDPASDGDQEIIDDGELTGRCSCRRCYYCCCCCYPSTCCRDTAGKHHHQGNYSQGPAIESEPAASGSNVTGVTDSMASATTYNVNSGSTGSFHHRVTPFLPLCLVSIFGFISKVSWGVLESVFGFNRSYTDHKDGGRLTALL